MLFFTVCFFPPLIWFIEMNETNWVSVSFALLPLYRFEIPFELILLKSFKTFKKHYTNGECKQIKYYSERVYQMEKVISILFKNIFDPNMSERVSMLRSLFCRCCSLFLLFHSFYINTYIYMYNVCPKVFQF